MGLPVFRPGAARRVVCFRGREGEPEGWGFESRVCHSATPALLFSGSGARGV